MGLEIPAWAVGVALIVFVSAIVKSVGRGGGGSNRKWARFEDSADHERRIADLEESHRQLSAGGNTMELERRVGELEERLDFAERMLAKKNDVERLGPPKA